MRVAAVQLNSTERGSQPRARRALVRAAAADGAELVVLPEKWTCSRRGALRAERSRSTARASGRRGWARELGVHLLAGSVAERVEGEEQLSTPRC